MMLYNHSPNSLAKYPIVKLIMAGGENCTALLMNEKLNKCTRQESSLNPMVINYFVRTDLAIDNLSYHKNHIKHQLSLTRHTTNGSSGQNKPLGERSWNRPTRRYHTITHDDHTIR